MTQKSGMEALQLFKQKGVVRLEEQEDVFELSEEVINECLILL